jgi:membrane associated rhomboid family serine protease
MTSILRRPLRYRFYNATIILIVVNVLVFLLGFVGLQRTIQAYLGLTPVLVLQAGAWWQPFTYMFVHAGWWHIFFNMLTLFLFGMQLEQRMGSSEFLLLYFISGLGAGLFTLFFNTITNQGMVSVVGASGAIYGLLLAFAAFFPDTRIFVFGIIPMRAPVAVAVFAGIEIVSQFASFQSGVAHLTHLAGLLFAWLYLVVHLGMHPAALFSRRR